MAGDPLNRRPERRKAADQPGVLVVDDEADIRELLELSLLRMGLRVESVGSVSEARARLDERPFDLCLTDMRLPDASTSSWDFLS